MGIPRHARTGPVMGGMFWDNMADRLASTWWWGGGLGAWGAVGVRMGGAEETQNAEEAQEDAVLCVFLLTCVKFDLGCGLRLPHSGSPRQIRRRWQAMEGSDASPFCTFAPCSWCSWVVT